MIDEKWGCVNLSTPETLMCCNRSRQIMNTRPKCSKLQSIEQCPEYVPQQLCAICLPHCRALDDPPSQKTSIYQSINLSLLLSLSLSLLTNQTNKPINQSINQSINKSNKQTSKQANKQANKQTSKQTSKQTNKQANKQDDKQANRQLTIQSRTTFTDVHLSDQPANDGQLISNGFPWISE